MPFNARKAKPPERRRPRRKDKIDPDFSIALDDPHDEFNPDVLELWLGISRLLEKVSQADQVQPTKASKARDLSFEAADQALQRTAEMTEEMVAKRRRLVAEMARLEHRIDGTLKSSSQILSKLIDGPSAYERRRKQR